MKTRKNIQLDRTCMVSIKWCYLSKTSVTQLQKDTWQLRSDKCFTIPWFSRDLVLEWCLQKPSFGTHYSPNTFDIMMRILVCSIENILTNYTTWFMAFAIIFFQKLCGAMHFHIKCIVYVYM